MNLQK